MTAIDAYFSTLNPDVEAVFKAIHVTAHPVFNLYNGDVRSSLAASGM